MENRVPIGRRLAAIGAIAAAFAVLVGGVLFVVAVFESDVVLAAVAVAVVAIFVAASVFVTRYALARDRRTLRAQRPPGERVARAERGVVFINPGSGRDGSDTRELQAEAQRRGIELIVLEPDHDVEALAERAVTDGADVIGMAGGDGSQASVARVAMQRDVAYVCIPAGTRNHFALDLGLDRDDLVGALDAFNGDATERRVDLATVGERVFVNNACMGVYAEIIQSPEYRNAKVKAAAAVLHERFGDDERSSTFRFEAPGGSACERSPLVLVSNNRYELSRFAGFGTRPRLDSGCLGIAALDPESKQLHEWSAATFTIESDEKIEIALDGEAFVMDSPLEFRSKPQALRVRIPRHAPGYSPAALAPPSLWWTVTALLGIVAGRQAGAIKR